MSRTANSTSSAATGAGGQPPATLFTGGDHSSTSSSENVSPYRPPAPQDHKGDSLPPPTGFERAFSGPSGSNDWKDTVMFLQRQQAMNQREMMGAMKEILERLDGGSSGSENGSHRQASTDRRHGRGSYRSVADVPVLTGAAHIASQPLDDVPGLDELRDSELAAARNRILALEQKVAQLEQQLVSKEMTIRRLSDAALYNVARSVDTSRRFTDPIAGGTSSGTTKAAVAHREAISKIMMSEPSSVSGHPPTSLREGAGDYYAQTPPPSSAGGMVPVSNESLKEFLRQHQLLCQQRLNSTSSLR